MIAPREEQYGVFRSGIFYLDHGVSRVTGRVDDDSGNIYAQFLEAIHQPETVLTDASGMLHLRPRPRQGGGLIGTFAAGKDFVRVARNRLAWLGNVIDSIDVIDIEGAEVENWRQGFSRSLRAVCNSVVAADCRKAVSHVISIN